MEETAGWIVRVPERRKCGSTREGMELVPVPSLPDLVLNFWSYGQQLFGGEIRSLYFSRQDTITSLSLTFFLCISINSFPFTLRFFPITLFTMVELRRLKVACSGLGRMGARHALHFLHRTPKAELVAAFTPDPKEAAWAKENLEPWGVKIYNDYDQMLKYEGLEAVVVATVTTAHAEQSIKAIKAGKHVLCEKPFSTNLEVVRIFFLSNQVIKANTI